MTRRPDSARMAALVGAIPLIAVLLFATSSAQAQQCDDMQKVAFSVYRVAAEVSRDIDQVEDTNPSEADCEKVCRVVANACKRAGWNAGRDLKTETRMVTKLVRTLCKTAQDPKGCRVDAESLKREEREAANHMVADVASLCEGNELTSLCDDLCNDDTVPVPTVCEDVFPADPVCEPGDPNCSNDDICIGGQRTGRGDC